MTGLWIVLGIAALLLAVIRCYAHRNLNYDKTPLRKAYRAGFTEKKAVLPDGTVLNYGEGPAGGPPLLLIHGQGVSWEDYAKALPALARRFHIFAVDCHGHGKSSADPAKYSAETMGRDFVQLIRQVIKEPVFVSGHSSGGLMTVWLAGKAPEWVRGIVIEDAPLFSTEEGEKEHTFAYRESFCRIHDFLSQSEEPDYLTYMLEHSCWGSLFGSGWPKILRSLQKFRARRPGEAPKVWWLPSSINRIWESISHPYDPRFGEAFYDQSWFAGFDQAQTLAAIRCPAVFLKATTNWKDGVLMAALSEEDTERVCALLPGCRRIDVKSGHDIHDEHPKVFAGALQELLENEKQPCESTGL